MSNKVSIVLEKKIHFKNSSIRKKSANSKIRTYNRKLGAIRSQKRKALEIR
jgi:hypothetical protein